MALETPFLVYQNNQLTKLLLSFVDLPQFCGVHGM